MKRIAQLFSLLLILAAFPAAVLAVPVRSVSLSPAAILQGDPVMIQIEGVLDLSEITKVSFEGKSLGISLLRGKPTAFLGIDLNKKPGIYPLMVSFADGTELSKDIAVNAREKYTAPLGIPAKLGGDTPAAAKNLVDTLAEENATFLGLRTGTHAFWILPFRAPLAASVVTDPYGYSRATGGYSITHKGTDFRAKEGTKVYAMNRGVVRIARTYRNYGKTIVVDHGFGVMTFYMHLSKIYVGAGELVTPGEIIGLSGQTGYAAEPHLHLTVRINDISIDPARFLEFFK